MQKEPGQGDDNDPLTWNYFAIVGKLDENGQRQLRYDRRQFHPTYLGPLGKTTQSEENIDWLGVSYLIFSTIPLVECPI
jgi:hypothetical protein